MATSGTKVPSIYKVPSKVDPELKLFADSVKEAVEIRLGRRGDPRDRAITLRELIDSGLAAELTDNPFDPNVGVGPIDFEVNPLVVTSTDLTVPLPPTGFTVAATYTSFILSWDLPQVNNFAYTEIWRSGSDDINTAARMDTTIAAVWSEEVGYDKTYYYWVRFVTTSDVIGPFFGPKSGTTSEDIAAVMEQLSQELANLPGYGTLINTSVPNLIATAKAEAIAGGSYIIRATSAPSVRDTSPTTALQQYDVWVDTDDTNQMYIRNSANDAWVEARDGTLVALVNTHASTISGHTTSIATANTDIATVTAANSALSTTVTNLSATVDTKAQTFAQNGAPADNSSNALLDGDLWIDTNDSNKLYRWDGDSWEEMIDPSSSGVSVYAQDAEPSGGTYIEGDLWFDTNDGNKQYRYNGSAWVAVDDARITTTSNALTSLTATVTGAGGHASQLTTLNSTITTKNQTFVQTSAPTAIAVGDLWVDSDDNNKMYRASAVGSSNWVSVRDTTIATAQTAASTAITNAATAQGTADGKVTTFFQNDAPTAEGTGDLWMDTNDGNKLYRWSGSAWTEIQDDAIATAISDAATAQSTADGKIISFYQTSTPTATSVGDLWVDTDDGNRLYRATATGTGNWVSVRDTTIATAQSTAATAITNAATAQGTADGKVTTFFQDGVPTSGVGAGDLWIDTNDGNKLYRAAADGSNEIAAGEWVEIQDAAIATAITNAATAQSTADGKIVTFYQTSAPTATSVGDLWVDTDDSNKLYRASATGTGNWVAVGADTNTTFAQDAEPGSSGLIAGDLWIDTNDNNKMYRWSGSAWVAIPDSRITTNATAVSNLSTAVGLSGTSSTKITALESTVNNGSTGVAANASAISTLNTSVTTKSSTYAQNAEPADDPVGTLKEGDLWADTNDNNKLYAWNDTTNAWYQIRDGNIAVAQTAADNAQSTANSKTKTFRQNGIPTAVTVGDVWIDTDDGNKMYLAAAVGSDQITSGEWEEATDAQITAAQTAASNAATAASNAQTTANSKAQTFVQDGEPADNGANNLKDGDIWIDSNDENKLYAWDDTNSEWDLRRDGLTSAHATAISGINTSITNLQNHEGKTFVQDAVPNGGSVIVKAGDLWIDTNSSPANQVYRATADNAAAIVTSGNGWLLTDVQGTTASVTSISTAVSTLEGDASAAYVLQVNANGSVAGMVIENTASSSGDNSGSAIQFRADKFAIWNATGSTAGSAGVAPFIVDNNVVYIDTARIKDASIEAAKIGSLNADIINAGSISATRLGAGTIDAVVINVGASSGSRIEIDGGNDRIVIIDGS